MGRLLVHSMSEFAPLIVSILRDISAKNIVEIGSEGGAMSKVLAELTDANGGRLFCVDPNPNENFKEWIKNQSSAVHVPLDSHSAIPTLANIDVWLIDGDHNWFTVYNELKLIEQNCIRDEKPFVCFLHDVSWPCDRRDFYYSPQSIPAQFCHDYTYSAGLKLDDDAVFENRGFRGNGNFAVAKHRGGPRNGVLTAVEDFVYESSKNDRSLLWSHIPAVFGLGVICDNDDLIGRIVSEYTAPYHNNFLLQKLEENRLRNYLHVIELQDNAMS
jgi:hypothetical protein